MKTAWKDIAPVPTSTEFLDIVLSRTQRQLPTQIRAGFQISRIRGFYTRKVRFTAETFSDKITAVLEGFPRLADIHPFYRDLLNTLYDADHLRISLGQLSTAKNLIETVARDYVRLLKYGQSLYQCKQLKRAALGRMATICKRLKDALAYLEQVRQHLGRLPSIDPNTRTLLICGYPNVGKSSFLKGISRADVEVQPYAFTTKSLYVGHFDYKMLRFQAIDTPGILDHPVEEMNAIEMQSITAIAHLRSAVLYFMDLSEHCGYSVAAQIQLFHNIKLLFSNKLVFIVVNKIDVKRLIDLDPEQQQTIQSMIKPGEVELLELSCQTTENVMQVRNAVCDRLLAERNAQRLQSGMASSGEPSGRLGELLKRIHVARPMSGVTTLPEIPDAIKNRVRYEKDDPNRPKLQRDIEAENGGAGVYNVQLSDEWKLENDEWKGDRMPEILNGQNVYDYVDPEIEAKLKALEEEEEKLQAEGFYDEDEEVDEDDEEVSTVRYKASLIREKQTLIRNENRMRKSLKNRAVMPRSATRKTAKGMKLHLETLGLQAEAAVSSAVARTRVRVPLRKPGKDEGDDDTMMDVDDGPTKPIRRTREPVTDRRTLGVTTARSQSKTEQLIRLGQTNANRHGRQGEADRHTPASLIKHLMSGKRGMGKTQWR